MKKTARSAGAATYRRLEQFVGLGGAIALALSALILLLLAGTLIAHASIPEWTTVGRIQNGEVQVSKDTIIVFFFVVLVAA